MIFRVVNEKENNPSLVTQETNIKYEKFQW